MSYAVFDYVRYVFGVQDHKYQIMSKKEEFKFDADNLFVQFTNGNRISCVCNGYGAESNYDYLLAEYDKHGNYVGPVFCDSSDIAKL